MIVATSGRVQIGPNYHNYWGEEGRFISQRVSLVQGGELKEGRTSLRSPSQPPTHPLYLQHIALLPCSEISKLLVSESGCLI